jgi:hypothetical protein
MVVHGVTGKSIHETRLVATMIVERVPSLLTFNTRDFARFNEIVVLEPHDVAQGAASGPRSP